MAALLKSWGAGERRTRTRHVIAHVTCRSRADLGLPVSADALAILRQRPAGCLDKVLQKYNETSALNLLQQRQRAGPIQWFPALFARVALLERVGVTDDPALLCNSLLERSGSIRDGDAVETDVLFGCQCPRKGLRDSERALRQNTARDGERPAHSWRF